MSFRLNEDKPSEGVIRSTEGINKSAEATRSRDAEILDSGADIFRLSLKRWVMRANLCA